MKGISILVCLTSTLLITGCGSNPKTTGANNDLSSVGPDLGMAPLTCLGLGGCILDCLNSGSMPGGDMGLSPIQGCLDSCAPQTSQATEQMWIDAFNCGIDFCFGNADASIAQCTGQGMDPPGAATGTCNTCIYNAPFLVLGDFSNPNVPVSPTGVCPNPTSPDCKGGNECLSKFTTCINQM